MPVLDFFPDRQFKNTDARKKAMTLEHLLTMTSGMECQDNWRYGWVGLSAMLNSPDWVQNVLDRPMSEAPGQNFEYCNGASFILAAILEKSTGMKALDFARKYLFGPLGMGDITWNASPKGINAGYAGLWMHPHDMAKVGQLYLQKGRWDGVQVVPAAWVERSTTAHVAARSLFSHYGYQWWRDRDGIYSGLGHGGQYILVVPKHNLVAVFTGDLKGPTIGMPRGLLRGKIFDSIAADKPLPENGAQQARIAALVATYAKPPEGGYVWGGGDNGHAQAGLFVRRAQPAFQLRYPLGSRRMDKTDAWQVMRLKGPGGIRMSASIFDIPKGATISGIGPGSYMTLLAKFGSELNLLSNVPVTLADGTSAYETTVRWKYNSVQLTSLALSVFKDGNWILVNATAFSEPEKARDFVRGLTFQTKN